MSSVANPSLQSPSTSGGRQPPHRPSALYPPSPCTDRSEGWRAKRTTRPPCPGRRPRLAHTCHS
eukprot:7126962-Prymnesium_polylepis.1